MKAFILLYLLLGLTLSSCQLSETGVDDSDLEQVRYSHPNGNPHIIATLKDKKKHGVSKTFFKNGQIETENHWENDIQVGSVKEWFKNGNKSVEGQLKDQQQDGKWKFYDDLNGKHAYSIYYNMGKIEKVKWGSGKYNWRTYSNKMEGLQFDFPSMITDSAVIPGLMSGYICMYPNTSKRDIEFYSVASMPSAFITTDIDSVMQNFNEASTRDALASIFSSSSNNPNIPNIKDDPYEIEKPRIKQFGSHKGYQIFLNYIDLDLNFQALVIPKGEEIFMIMVYTPEDIDPDIPERFLNSVSVD